MAREGHNISSAPDTFEDTREATTTTDMTIATHRPLIDFFYPDCLDSSDVRDGGGVGQSKPSGHEKVLRLLPLCRQKKGGPPDIGSREEPRRGKNKGGGGFGNPEYKKVIHSRVRTRQNADTAVSSSRERKGDMGLTQKNKVLHEEIFSGQ